MKLTRALLNPKNIIYLFRELSGIPQRVFANKTHLKAAIEWIKFAQDSHTCGGIPAGYSLIEGWRAFYPETTGYIMVSMIEYCTAYNDSACIPRIKKMADWLTSIQLSNGGFIGGLINNPEVKIPLVFDTGQAMQGLIHAYLFFNEKKYLEAANRAASFIVSSQDTDGAWRKYSHHGFAHAYYTRVAWPVLELYFITQEEQYKACAIKNIEFALKNQSKNGWFKSCGFTQNEFPLTHTLAYTVEGILECGILLKNQKYISSALLTLKKFNQIISHFNHFSARYDEKWRPHENYSCLTGNAQIAMLLLKAYSITKNKDFLLNAIKSNKNLKKGQVISPYNPYIKGAIKGSQPIYGKYGPFMVLNWATKFFIDSLMLEEKLTHDW